MGSESSLFPDGSQRRKDLIDTLLGAQILIKEKFSDDGIYQMLKNMFINFKITATEILNSLRFTFKL